MRAKSSRSSVEPAESLDSSRASYSAQMPANFAEHELREVTRLAVERRASLLRQGIQTDLVAATHEARLCVQLARTRHPDDLPEDLRRWGDPNVPRLLWQRNYVLAKACQGRPVWLAPRGTDFMPVRCLVARPVGEGGRQVQVVVVEESLNPGSLQVVTHPTLKALRAIAIDVLRLQLSEGLFWPSSAAR